MTGAGEQHQLPARNLPRQGASRGGRHHVVGLAGDDHGRRRDQLQLPVKQRQLANERPLLDDPGP